MCGKMSLPREEIGLLRSRFCFCFTSAQKREKQLILFMQETAAGGTFESSSAVCPGVVSSDTAVLLCYRCVSLYPDVVSGGVLLCVSAGCWVLLSGQCHWSHSGSSLSVQHHLQFDLGGPATTLPRPVRTPHTYKHTQTLRLMWTWS